MESRRVASWRDPDGREIGRRTKASAVRMLKEYKKLIEEGTEDLGTLAEQVSDCDTAKHGGDLGWFAANYAARVRGCCLALRVPDDNGGEGRSAT